MKTREWVTRNPGGARRVIVTKELPGDRWLDMLARAESRWPGIAVERGAFIAHLAGSLRSDLSLEQALQLYKLDNGFYPTTDQGLDALAHKTSSPPVPRAFTPGGYIKSDGLEDPWGQAFQYRIPGSNNPHSFDLWSLGPDGVEGGDDIANWTINEEA